MNIELLHKIKDVNVLVFGDYMVDKYIMGEVHRISPEAPVPVIEVTKESQKLGGAGNVINNIISLGGKVTVLGCIGKDEAGNFIKDYFKESSLVNTNYLKQYKDFKTIIKTRVVSKNQQFLRIDEEEKKAILDEYITYIANNIDKILKNIDVIVISDYNKGSVTKKIAQLLIKKAHKAKIPVIVDPKGADYSKYVGATICTPNVKELSDVSKIKIETELDVKKYGTKLCKDCKLSYLMLTRSEKGISIINNKGDKKDYPAIAKEVIDVSGAGDTVVAITSLLLGIDYKMEDIPTIANLAASIVVSKFGTATISLNELLSEVCNSGEFKYQSLNTLKYIIDSLKEKNKKIVFTNGCFDMLHVGHVTSFKEAKKYGDILVVAVNSDKSVKNIKGDLRPIINEKDRIEMLCSLEMVDYVVLMEDNNPINIIKTLKPDICVKGEDWKDKKVPEKEIIDEYGGKMEFIKLNPNHSTTKIIEKVIKAYEK